MENQKIGLYFLLIATLLYSTKYIVAALGAANISNTWDQEELLRFLSHTPTSLNVLIYAAFSVGIIYMLVGYGLAFYKNEKK